MAKTVSRAKALIFLKMQLTVLEVRFSLSCLRVSGSTQMTQVWCAHVRHVQLAQGDGELVPKATLEQVASTTLHAGMVR